MKKRLILRRGGPDVLTEELVNVVSGEADFEFKPMFAVVYANLRARNAAHGGEEMLRLRLYEKLQWLVQVGGVDKTGKMYRANHAKLRPITEQLAAKHCRELLDAARCARPEAPSIAVAPGALARDLHFPRRC
jgi:hypothetical protein